MSKTAKPVCLIGLDLGTTALKGVLLCTDGRTLKTAERQNAYEQPAPEHVEQDPESHWREVVGLIRELAEASPFRVVAVAAAAASGNTMLADAQGRPLRPIINWTDRRSVGNPPPSLAGLEAEEVRQITGWPCVEVFPLAQLAWLRQHQPELLAGAAHVCMNTDWLLFRLTGQWRMDHSTATTFMLQNQVRQRWHQPYLERFGLRPGQLSQLCMSGVAAGKLTPAAAAATGLDTETIAVTGSFDHPAAARGVGVLEPGQLLLSCGTSWVGFTPAVQRDAIVGAQMLCDPFLADRGGPWAGMFSVPAIGNTINWYVDNVIAPDEKPQDRLRIFDEAAAAAKPGADGLVIDLLAPPQPVAGDRANVSRAVMEAAARALNAHLLRLRGRGFSFNRAVLVGGPSKSPVWPGIIAEITGLELQVGSAHAGARGAAILAGIGAGVFKDEAAALTALAPKPAAKTAPKTDIGTGDRLIYERELRAFLPAKIFDAHVHLFDRSCLLPGAELPAKSCYRKFGGFYTHEQMLEWAAEWLPEQELHLNSFGHPCAEADLAAAAAYTGKVSDNRRYFGMALVSPKDKPEAVAARIEKYRLAGYKPYLNFVDWKPGAEITIEDMLPEAQMNYADRNGLAVTLHIPRPWRLADPLNQAQMVELCRRFPNTRIIFAHIGRAYYLNNVIGLLDGIAVCPNAYIDTAMVNHEGVLEYAFRHFPLERILFGSDAPIAMLRGKSVEINNQYAYLMGEDYEIGTSIFDARRAVAFTSFYYEQLRGVKLAAERACLSRHEIEDIFFNNAHRLFIKVRHGEWR